MPSSFTSNLRLTLPATGENNGTWGTLVNTGITTLIDSSVAGTASVTMTDADYTLTNLNGAADEARCMFINLTGTLTATRNVICPSNSKLYFVYNNTTGSQAIVFKTLAGSGITIPNGKRAALYCNGTNVVYAFDQVSLTPTVTISGTIDSAATDYGVNLTNTTVKSNVTALAAMFRSNPSTDAASFTLTSLQGFLASQGTFGAGSTVTNQYGFVASSNLTGAQNNFGYFSNLASQSPVTISSINGTGSTVTVDTATAHGLVTGNTVLIAGVPNTSMTSGTYNGGPYTVTVVDTDTFTFNSTATSSAAVTSGNVVLANRWNFYASNTGQNYFGGPTIISANSVLDGLRITQAGSGNALVVEDASLDSSPFVITGAGDVGIGATPLGSNRLFIGGTFPSTSSQTQVVRVTGTFPSATTGTAISFMSRPVTAAASYTLSDLIHFQANPDTFGAGSAVTNQFGFYADNTLTAATNNYGFYSAIASGSGRWSFYAAGTANNYFAGNVGIGVAPTEKLNIQDSASGGSAVVRVINSGSPITNNKCLISFDTANTGLGVRDAQIYAINGGTNNVSLAFATANGSTPVEAMRISPAGNIGIGTASPTAKLDVFGNGFFQADDSSAEVQIRRASDNSGGALFYLNKARGTTASRTVVQSGDTVGTTFWRGWDGSAFVPAAAISVEVDNTPGASDMPGRMIFSTTANGASSTTERMRIDSTGAVGIGTGSPTALLTVNGVGAFGAGTDAAPSITKFDDLDTGVWFPSGNNIAVSTAGVERLRVNASGNLYITSPAAFGYSTGAGGSVTQATSRTTGVTINFPTGRITLFSAAGTTAWQSFTVTNSTVDSSDNVIVNQRSGTDLYQIFVTNVTAGSFRITFATTGGTTTEAPTFSFSVVKGAIT